MGDWPRVTRPAGVKSCAAGGKRRIGIRHWTAFPNAYCLTTLIMHDRKQYNLALAGLIMTLIGLATLFLVPLAVASRLQREYGRIDQLEHSRIAIGDAIEVA